MMYCKLCVDLIIRHDLPFKFFEYSELRKLG